MDMRADNNDFGKARADDFLLRQDVWQHLRKINNLLLAGKTEQARTLLEKLQAEPERGSELPPWLMLLRGRLLLQEGDKAGVTELFGAAERDPALLEQAATLVGQWLDGPGREHDSMLLRHELMRMQTLHQQAWQERQNVSGSEHYSAPEEAEARAVSDALDTWRDDIRTAWLAVRHCEHMPRWRHLELLLELKPRRWHFQDGARERLQHLLMRIEENIPLRSGSIAVRAHPLLALPAHVRNMRRQATQILPAATAADATATQRDAEAPRHDDMAEQPSVLAMDRRTAIILRSSLLAAMLAVPLWIGWGMISNHETRQRLASLEHRHVAVLNSRYWRKEEAAGAFSPEKTVQAFLAALRFGDDYLQLPVLDAASRKRWAKTRLSRQELWKLAARWQGCGAPRTLVEHDHAIIRWPAGSRRCMPLLLHREDGRWRIAWNDMQAAFQHDRYGRWHLAQDAGKLLGAWVFAFRDSPQGQDGARDMLATHGAKGDGARISPVSAPHHEKGKDAQASRLETTALLLHTPDDFGQ